MERRILIGVYIVIFIFTVFIFRLWSMQIIKGREYKQIAERNRLRNIEIPAPRGIIYDRNNNPFVKTIPSFDISVVREDFPQEPETLSALGRLLGLDADYIEERLNKLSVSPFEPVKLKLDVSFEEAARAEARKIDFPGLQVDVVVSRDYLYGQLASHVIGYLGHLTLKQAKDPGYKDVPREAFIGQVGVEKIYDKVLRGTAGRKIIEVDATGRVIKDIGEQRFVKGDDIRLTLDMNLQAVAENELIGKAGAVVALDTNSGEILVLASAPTFDPNLFARGINYEDWQDLVNNPKNPFLNRAIQSQYPPGSTFKIITTIAGLEEGAITEDSRFECRGSINIGRVFKCWKKEGHGNTDLYRAVVESCDVFFYGVGKRLGVDALAKYASEFGLGKPVGIELEGEKPGLVPSTAWKLNTKKQKWFMGETLNTAIGQGYLSVTPIQMASLMSTVANGGEFYKPHLIKNSVKGTVSEKTMKISPETINFIKRALVGVVSEKSGTGRIAYSSIIPIGGKTGTAQVISGDKASAKYRDHAWFVAFAPEEKPRIAVAVFVEHGGHGSSAAAPIAKKIIEEFYKKNLDAEQKYPLP
ncbi:MAG: penicillin-binding protein 2 [Nitrospirota bacterium]